MPDKLKADDKCQIAMAAVHGLTLVSLSVRDMEGRDAVVFNPGRNPTKLYTA